MRPMRRPMSPAPTTRTFAPTRLACVRGVHRPASCSRTKNGRPRWAASVAATAHSAVEGVCAPRALHRVTPSGSRPAKRSAPALSSWTTRRSGSAAKKSPSGRSIPPERGIHTLERAASPVGSPSSADHRWARTRGDTASTAAASAREGTRTSSTSSGPTSGSLTSAETRRNHPLRSRRARTVEVMRRATAGALLATALLLAGCGSDGYEPSGPFRPLPEGAPPEVGPPPSSAPTPGRPAEPGAEEQDGDPNVVATGLAVPTGLALLPDGSAVVGERDTGRILQVFPDRSPARELMVVPGVDAAGDGGLLGLAVSPTYPED